MEKSILQETNILYEDGDGKILTPLTMRASIAWGRGTRWCVADKDEERNTFESYARQSPLVFYITNEWKYVPATKKDHQIKFCGHRREKHLVDISVTSIPNELPLSLQELILRSNLLPFLFRDGKLHPYHFAPKSFNEIQINGLIKKGFNLSEFDSSDLTEEHCLTAIERISPWQIRQLPDSMLTQKICTSAARRDFTIIHKIDRDLPYFEDVRRAAFENYQTAPDNTESKRVYANWFHDLIAKKEADSSKPSASLRLVI